MQIYNYFYLNEMNISSIRKRCAEYLRKSSEGKLTPTHLEMLTLTRLAMGLVLLHLSRPGQLDRNYFDCCFGDSACLHNGPVF